MNWEELRKTILLIFILGIIFLIISFALSYFFVEKQNKDSEQKRIKFEQDFNKSWNENVKN